MSGVRAVLVEVPPALLEERRRLGHDLFDEEWEGELHMVPPPSSGHQRLGSRLFMALAPAAARASLVLTYETGVYAPGRSDDYRVPDLVLATEDIYSTRGVEGAATLAVELRSPGDETYAKLDFYARVGVQALLVVNVVSCAVELFVLRGDRLVVVQAARDGWLTLESLGLDVRERDGELELRDGDEVRTV